MNPVIFSVEEKEGPNKQNAEKQLLREGFVFANKLGSIFFREGTSKKICFKRRRPVWTER